jgi:hypothetical protein
MLLRITEPIHHGRGVAHLLLSLAFLLTRTALARVGLQFSFSLDWMWMADPVDLRDRLAETLYYLHAFPPGMNLFTGLLLKLAPDDPGSLAHAAFALSGLVLVNAMFALGQALGLPRAAAFGAALAFSLTPATIYFEHLYLYELPVTTLLCFAMVVFHRALERPSTARWSIFFLLCAAIGLTRSTFHLIWFMGMAGFSLWFAPADGRRRVLLAGAVPLVLLLAVYAKNYALFGEFAVSTFGPASFHLVTVDRLPQAERDAWIAAGRLSPFAAISPYASPRSYLSHFDGWQQPQWPPQLTRLDHPSVSAANFNHWLLLEVHRARRQDVVEYLRAHPWGYLRNVLIGLRDLLRPSTEWHPRTGTAQAPHAQHRLVLGAYESWYNRTVHQVPVAPIGLYVFLPIVWLWGVWQGGALARDPHQPAARTRGAVLLLCLFQILYVVAASSALTYLEESRYRFQIEPMIWLVTALCLATAYGHLSHRRHL